jgi:hypothetical protein
MTFNHFLRNLVATTIGTALLTGLLMRVVPTTQAHLNMFIGTLCLFIGLSVVLYVAGGRLAKSTNRLAFNNLIAGSIFAKMILCMAFLLGYKSLYNPSDSWFVAIFLLSYVTYTIFEVWFMTRLAKSS